MTSEWGPSEDLRTDERQEGKAGASGVVKAAEGAALELHSGYIGTEHLLLGLLRADGLAAQALNDCGLTEEQVRADLLRAVPAGARPVVPSARTPRLSPASKRALRRASDSLSLQGDQVDTEHVLLGIIHDGGALASRVIEGRLDVVVLRTCLLKKMRSADRATGRRAASVRSAA